MKARKILAIILIGVMMLSAAFTMSSCGQKEEEKPETLEEYVEQSEDAGKELEGIGNSMSNEMLDGTVDVKNNAIIITCKLKETYKSKDFEKLADQFSTQFEEYKDQFDETLDSMEKESGIEGAEIQIIVQNGDGEEIYSETFTKD